LDLIEPERHLRFRDLGRDRPGRLIRGTRDNAHEGDDQTNDDEAAYSLGHHDGSQLSLGPVLIHYGLTFAGLQ
jgi:hypothetical protein